MCGLLFAFLPLLASAAFSCVGPNSDDWGRYACFFSSKLSKPEGWVSFHTGPESFLFGGGENTWWES